MVNQRAHQLIEWAHDFGMLIALLLLAGLFSLLTINPQFPTGRDAGKQVADTVLDRFGADATVLIVGREIDEDRAFTAAVAEELREAGAQVPTVVNGSAIDARRAIEQILQSGKSIDVVAANSVTAGWSIYERFPEVGRDKLVTPQAVHWPDFLKLSNLLGVANQTAIYAVIAIGMTMVIITAGIDLSVGSLVALSSVCSALVIREYFDGRQSDVMAIAVAMNAGLLVCSLAGMFSGAMITAFQLPPFIVTLGMMMMASGLAYRLAEGRSIPELPEAFFWLGGGQVVGVPNPIWLMIILYIVGHVVMRMTVFGRYVYAIGGNAEAARLSGVPVRRVLVAVYTISGALAGLGGVVLTSKLAAGDPKFGSMYELEVIAAVVVGGTSLMGGQGSVFGTLVGAFIIAVIKNGMNLINIDPFNQKIVLGAVLLAAVLLDQLKRRGATAG